MKKIILIIVLSILILIVGLAFYKYFLNNNLKIETPIEQKPVPSSEKKLEQKEPSATPEKAQIQGIEAEGNNAGNLMVCLDKCGDGVCQKTDANCVNGNLNCICSETQEDCPQDCK